MDFQKDVQSPEKIAKLTRLALSATRISRICRAQRILRWSSGLHNSKSEAIHYMTAEQEHSFCYYRFKHTDVSDLPSCLASLCQPSRQILRAQIPKGIQVPKATNLCWLQNQPLLSPGIKALAHYYNVSGDNTQTVQLHNSTITIPQHVL